MLAGSALTWYDFKQVSAGFVRIGCELVDLAALQRYAALEHKQRKHERSRDIRSGDTIATGSHQGRSTCRHLVKRI